MSSDMSKRAMNSATQRLKYDYMRLKKDPIPYIVAEPLPSNIFEWHYVIHGPESSPYQGGIYHGKLVFPREFPFKPPSIYMLTPNGRFKTNTRLCLSISDYHPDLWNPAWSGSTILTGLLSFMLESSHTLGSIDTSDQEKQQLAHQSLAHNLANQQFCEQFPDIAQTIRAELSRREKLEEEARRKQEENRSTENDACQSEITCTSLQSVVSNLAMVLVLAAFVFVVRYVVTSTPME